MEYFDQLHHKVVLKHPPQKIVSLVPSQTELLAHLGLSEEVVGITKFCVHPNEWFKSKTRVGGTKTIDYDLIKSINPDLIITNKEENTKEIVETLSKHYSVWTSDIYTLEDVYEMTLCLGEITDRNKVAKQLVSELQNEFSKLHDHCNKLSPLKTAYLIWNKPYMMAASNTFINHILEICKLTLGKDVVKYERYPKMEIDSLIEFNPEVILLSSEPFPFNETHIRKLKDQFPKAKVLLCDGELCSWYGSRLKGTPKYLIELLKKVHSLS